MLELSIGDAPEDVNFATELLEKSRSQNGSRAAIAVEDDLKFPGTDFGDVDKLENSLKMRGVRIGGDFDGSELVPGGEGEGFGIEDLQELFAGGLVVNASFRGEGFQAVPLNRIVAGGDLDSSGSLKVVNQDSASRSRSDVGIDDLASRRGEASENGLFDHQARAASVTADDDRPSPRESSDRGSEVHEKSGFEAVSDDSSESGDAENPLSHVCLLR